MAKAPPPEPIDHHYNIPKLTKAFALSSLATLAAFGLMVREDHFRDWRDWQQEFRKNERGRTQAALQTAAAKIDPNAEGTVLAKKREGRRYLRQHRSGLAKAEAQSRAAEGKWYGADQEFRFR